MSNDLPRVEIITSRERRRRWSANEKLAAARARLLTQVDTLKILSGLAVGMIRCHWMEGGGYVEATRFLRCG